MGIQETVPAINVSVTQFRPERLKLLRALVPIAPLASIAVRRAFGVISVVLAVGLLLGLWILLLRSRRSLGRQDMRMIDGARCSLGTPLILTRQQISSWTISDNGRKAHLYCHDLTVRLKCKSTDAQRLREQLTSWLGAPLELHRRGSRRSRSIAAAVSVSGLVLIALAFVLESVACAVTGLPLLIFGFAAFGALSQRVAQPSQSTASKSEYPELEQLFGAYFNQDFDLSGDTVEEIVSCYKRESSPEARQQLLDDIARFANAHDAEMDRAFSARFGGDVDVASWGHDATSFLQTVRQLVGETPVHAMPRGPSCDASGA